MCEQLRGGQVYRGEGRRYLYLFGHHHECPQYVPQLQPGSVRERPLVAPLRRTVGKRRARRRPGKPQ